MASASTKSLPIHIVEDHNEALEHIYRAIGSKKLPYTGICLLHLDAHPDLLSPDLPADLVYEKETLYETISISDWILPAVYAGHFNSIVWLKPPWSIQMMDGCYQLTVGRHHENGMIRVNLPLPYYLNEGLYCLQTELENIQSIPLYVFTVDIIKSSSQSSPSHSPSLSYQTTSNASSHSHLTESSHDIPEWFFDLRKILSTSSAWVLDIDLDFFSTVNPFKNWFTEEQFTYLKQLYEPNLPTPLPSDSEQIAKEVNETRVTRLSSLLKLWTEESETIDTLQAQIKSIIGQERNGETIEASDLHIAGMMTDLPHHISKDEEIVYLTEAIRHLLNELIIHVNLPTLVTVARSTEDEYTPPTQVNQIQESVVAMATKTFPITPTINRHYIKQF